MPDTKQHVIEEKFRRMTSVSAPSDQHEDMVKLIRLLVRLARARRRGGASLPEGPPADDLELRRESRRILPGRRDPHPG